MNREPSRYFFSLDNTIGINFLNERDFSVGSAKLVIVEKVKKIGPDLLRP